MNKKMFDYKSTRQFEEPYLSIIRNHNKIIKKRTIKYYNGDSYNDNNNIDSLNNYLAQELPSVVQNMISDSDVRLNDENKAEIDNVEFIIIHDTEGNETSKNALAMSNYCVNDTVSASWHYTVGNDGIYQQLPNNIVGWHAGDGSTATKLFSTGIVASDINHRPVVTIGDDGYYYLDDVKSSLSAKANFLLIGLNIIPPTSKSLFNSLGLAAVIKNGVYHIPYVYFNDTYGVYSIKGGGSSIGIETCVNKGSDIFLTWHLTAKLTAQLLIQFDLGVDRVLFHNNFSGKECPKTMIRNNMINTFLNMVKIEYFILKNNYNIVFKNLDEITINGRNSTLESKSYSVNNKFYLLSNIGG